MQWNECQMDLILPNKGVSTLREATAVVMVGIRDFSGFAICIPRIREFEVRNALFGADGPCALRLLPLCLSPLRRARRADTPSKSMCKTKVTKRLHGTTLSLSTV
eukprot:CAMPEP_0174361632 /NCGR_PEP_ID=MMETSP0811_2-20130205/60097_1 /TAXON_ID=73025 ORGANISM="Eutreptiella gymnastica-like, Strain CCMP1594" /NCGR_SAMPLE_ID=MMETSP0811_2 /ASSEMBLY_ACC=CAM_ASM_000667 /LENGTH=104 /DNA_ID=CAMNT_0015498437 /DNA_START=950 /DNA_END=1264 /DNA_ORIENTATION=+